MLTMTKEEFIKEFNNITLSGLDIPKKLLKFNDTSDYEAISYFIDKGMKISLSNYYFC